MFMVDLIIESNKLPMPRSPPADLSENTPDNNAETSLVSRLETIERLLALEEERIRSINPEDIRGKLNSNLLTHLRLGMASTGNIFNYFALFRQLSEGRFWYHKGLLHRQ